MSDKTQRRAEGAGQAELLYIILCVLLMLGLALAGIFLIRGLQSDLHPQGPAPTTAPEGGGDG